MDDERAFETGCEISNVVRPEPMDVVPESVTRRRWSVGAKERIVAESLVPDANVAEVARRYGILPQQLYAWRREMCEREKMTFVPAVIEEQADPPLPAGRSDAEIIVEVGNIRLRVPDTASADHVERVFLAVMVSA
jgi:transposase